MRVLVPLVVALAVLPLPAGAAPRENPVLDAIVGTNDAFQITLNDATGAKVSIIPPGTYTVVVHDNSAIHNFHLASNQDPTVDFRTDVDFVGTKTFTVTFRPATLYAYAFEPHWQVMNGSFLTERAGGHLRHRHRRRHLRRFEGTSRPWPPRPASDAQPDERRGGPLLRERHGPIEAR
jgi:hypothetical protein